MTYFLLVYLNFSLKIIEFVDQLLIANSVFKKKIAVMPCDI